MGYLYVYVRYIYITYIIATCHSLLLFNHVPYHWKVPLTGIATHRPLYMIIGTRILPMCHMWVINMQLGMLCKDYNYVYLLHTCQYFL